MSYTNEQKALALLEVADHIETLGPDEFDQTTWQCGTAACTAGWYVRLHPDERLLLRGNALILKLPSGSEISGPRALMVYFDFISPDDRGWLFGFSAGKQVTAPEQAATIRRIMSQYLDR